MKPLRIITVICMFLSVLLLLQSCSKKRIIPTGPVNSNTATFTFTSTDTPNGPTSTFTNTFTPTSTHTPIPKGPGWIDDLEDPIGSGENQNDFQATGGPVHDAGGYWITFDDNSQQNNGTSYVWPMAETWAARKGATHTPFTVSSPGYPGSLYGGTQAARITGYVTGCSGGSGNWWLDTTCTGPGTVTIYNPSDETTVFRFGFIGMGCQLISTAGEGATGFTVGGTTAADLIDVAGDCQEVDISGFTGLRFWYKGDGLDWRVKIPFTNQINCDGKYHAEFPDAATAAAIMATASYTAANDMGYNITGTATGWTQISIPFTDLAYETWSNPLVSGCTAPGGDCSKATVLQHVKQIQFQTFAVNVTADQRYPNIREFWIDDIELY